MTYWATVTGARGKARTRHKWPLQGHCRKQVRDKPSRAKYAYPFGRCCQRCLAEP